MSSPAREPPRESGETPPFWSAEPLDVVRRLGTDPIHGLSSAEAEARRRVHGPNELREAPRPSRLARMTRQLKSPVVMTLILATLISAAIGQVVDAVAILAIVILNAWIGFIQESKAEAAVEALKKLAAPRARVLRDSRVTEVPAGQICVGDILVFEAGDYIAADSRLITASKVSTDEALLTGESVPVKKQLAALGTGTPLADRSNLIFGGTLVATGSGRAIVLATGMETEIGRIASMLEETEAPVTPLQYRLGEVSSKLLVASTAIVAVIGVLGFVHGEDWLTVLMNGISLAVAAIPEGLPTVVTLALALAIRRMATRNAIVRQLPGVETLGSTDVICTDKTGTLTTGKMRVRELVAVRGAIRRVEDVLHGDTSPYLALIRASLLCSNASLSRDGVPTGDPTEVALLLIAKDVLGQTEIPRAERIAEWSFDSLRKRMSVAVREPGGEIWLYCKGAPETVIERSTLELSRTRELHGLIDTLSSQGRRLLAVARRRLPSYEPGEGGAGTNADRIERDLEFLGLIAIADPPRPEAIAAIARCKRAGIQVVMMTGDHPATARAIAAELGILVENPDQPPGVLTGGELQSLSLDELQARVPHTFVYARVAPEHKLTIVKAWRALGKTVAMTGDGVNDAPALKAASIGIAMGKGGTEVARQASSMILADDNFATIVAAVEEGRAIYGNIRRTIQYLLSGNIAEILIMFGAAVAGWPVPLAPIHLLWINLVTDGLPSLALAAEPVPAGLLETSDKPSPRNFFERSFYAEMLLVGLITTTMALSVYAYSLKYEDAVTARTHVFSFLVFAELFRSFASRSETKTYFQIGPLSNLYHLGAVAVPIGFQLLLHHSTWLSRLFGVRVISWKECFAMIGLTLVPVTIIEIRKLIRNSR